MEPDDDHPFLLKWSRTWPDDRTKQDFTALLAGWRCQKLWQPDEVVGGHGEGELPPETAGCGIVAARPTRGRNLARFWQERGCVGVGSG